MVVATSNAAVTTNSTIQSIRQRHWKTNTAVRRDKADNTVKKTFARDWFPHREQSTHRIAAAVALLTSLAEQRRFDPRPEVAAGVRGLHDLQLVAAFFRLKVATQAHKQKLTMHISTGVLIPGRHII